MGFDRADALGVGAGESGTRGTGLPWPPLAEQYQMREQAVELLSSTGYYEHPTTYFLKQDRGPEVCRSLNLDQSLQAPQVGVGLGGYSSSIQEEATMTSDPRAYRQGIADGKLPLESITVSTPEGSKASSPDGATNCQPFSDAQQIETFGV